MYNSLLNARSNAEKNFTDSKLSCVNFPQQENGTIACGCMHKNIIENSEFQFLCIYPKDISA